jgi:4-hydroxybenzoate polyprenyltransferase
MPLFLQKIIRLFFFGNLFISCGAVALVHCTCMEMGIVNITPYYYGLVFFSTLFIYNLQRFFIANKLPPQVNERKQWIQKNKYTILALIIAGAGGSMICYLLFTESILLPLLPFFMLSLAYFFPPFELRKKTWAKTITLALVWTGSTAFLPIILSGQNIYQWSFIIHLISRFCFMASICMVFDLRDIKTDKEENATTIALVIGERKTVLLALGFMLMHGIFAVIEYAAHSISIELLIALLAAALLNALIVGNTNIKKGEYYYIAGIDGTIIIQWLCMLWAIH